MLHHPYPSCTLAAQAPTPGLRTSEHTLSLLEYFKAEVEALAAITPDPDAPSPIVPDATLEARRAVVYSGVLPGLLAYLRSVAAAARGAPRLPDAQQAVGLLLSSAVRRPPDLARSRLPLA